MESVLLDSPATAGRPPRCPAIAEAVHHATRASSIQPIHRRLKRSSRSCAQSATGRRLRALIVLLWGAGLRISEALALQESDLDRSPGAVLGEVS
jgi:site-specific recombinase XerD